MILLEPQNYYKYCGGIQWVLMHDCECLKTCTSNHQVWSNLGQKVEQIVDAVDDGKVTP